MDPLLTKGGTVSARGKRQPLQHTQVLQNPFNHKLDHEAASIHAPSQHPNQGAYLHQTGDVQHHMLSPHTEYGPQFPQVAMTHHKTRLVQSLTIKHEPARNKLAEEQGDTSRLTRRRVVGFDGVGLGNSQKGMIFSGVYLEKNFEISFQKGEGECFPSHQRLAQTQRSSYQGVPRGRVKKAVSVVFAPANSATSVSCHAEPQLSKKFLEVRQGQPVKLPLSETLPLFRQRHGSSRVMVGLPSPTAEVRVLKSPYTRSKSPSVRSMHVGKSRTRKGLVIDKAEPRFGHRQVQRPSALSSSAVRVDGMPQLSGTSLDTLLELAVTTDRPWPSFSSGPMIKSLHHKLTPRELKKLDKKERAYLKAQGLLTFHKFMKLPTELRWMIYSLMTPDRRIIEIKEPKAGHSPGAARNFMLSYDFPAVLYISLDARRWAKTTLNYKLSFGNNLNGRQIYYDPARDSLLFHSLPLFEKFFRAKYNLDDSRHRQQPQILDQSKAIEAPVFLAINHAWEFKVTPDTFKLLGQPTIIVLARKSGTPGNMDKDAAAGVLRALRKGVAEDGKKVNPPKDVSLMTFKELRDRVEELNYSKPDPIASLSPLSATVIGINTLVSDSVV